MCASTKDEKPALIPALLKNKCPRCRRGNIFKQKSAYQINSFMQMNDHCPVCGQPFDMEPGFYYGTSYVSYALSVAICVTTFIAWWIFIGFSLHDNRLFWWLGINAFLLIILQPPLMRLARTIWLSFFVRYSAEWDKGDVVKAERANETMKNAW